VKKLAAVAVSCVAVVSLAACGSSSKNASTSKETSTTASATASASANANVSAAADLLKYCDYSKAAQAFSIKNPSSLTNPTALKDQLNNLKANADAYVNVAPSEIKGDVSIYINDFLKPLITALDQANYDFTKLNPTAFSSLENGKVQTALTNIGNYYASHCNK